MSEELRYWWPVWSSLGGSYPWHLEDQHDKMYRDGWEQDYPECAHRFHTAEAAMEFLEKNHLLSAIRG